MSGSSGGGVGGGGEPDARALRQMVHELAEEPCPSLDWERAEARLETALAGSAAPGSEPLRAPAEIDELEPGTLVTASGSMIHVPVTAAERSVMLASPAPQARTGERSAEPVTPTERRLAPRLRGWALAAAALAIAASFAAWVSRAPQVSPEAAAVAGGTVSPVAVSPVAPIAVVLAEPIEPSSLPWAAGLDRTRDVGSLSAGDVVEAAAGPLSFGRAGVLSWTLSPGGRLRIEAGVDAVAHVLVLEVGSVDGAVMGETELVIASDETEVASRGASELSVTRSSRGVVVNVVQGAALVGARGGAGERRLLEAPQRGRFSLDGGRTFELVPDEVASNARFGESEVSSSPPSASPRGGLDAVRAEPSELATKAATPGASELPAAPRAPTTEAVVRSRLVRCLADARKAEIGRRSGAAGGKPGSTDPATVSVSVSSTLRIHVDEAGAVKAAAFSPPLLPELQGCAVFVFSERFEPGKRVLSVPVQLE